MNTFTTYSAAAAAAIAFSATASFASTISSVEIITIGGLSGSVNDSVAGGDVTVNGLGGSVATQNADGTSRVIAAAGLNFGSPTKTTSIASFEQSATNNETFSLDYTLNYELEGQTANFLEGFGGVIDDGEFVTDVRRLTGPSVASAPTVANTNNPFTLNDDPNSFGANPSLVSAASFEYIISVSDGTTETVVLNARADALIDDFMATELTYDAVSGFTPTSSRTATGFSFGVAPISGEIELGSYAPGTTLTVVSTLIARAYAPGLVLIDIDEVRDPQFGTNALSFDPVNLSGTGAPSNVTTFATPTPTAVSPIPLPAAGWMLIAGLGGLAAARRRKS